MRVDEGKPLPARVPIKHRRTGPTPSKGLSEGWISPEVQEAVRQAADRIGEWTPKGVHFGWESSFKNKGKFLAAMTKKDARTLVREALQKFDLKVYPNQRGGEIVADQILVVADIGRPIGTRDQTRIRIVIIRDAKGYLVDNAFPVRIR